MGAFVIRTRYDEGMESAEVTTSDWMTGSEMSDRVVTIALDSRVAGTTTLDRESCLICKCDGSISRDWQ
jgi:hypothetical protein